MEEKMNELFSQNPKIELNIECYHIESVDDFEGRASDKYIRVIVNKTIPGLEEFNLICIVP